MSERKKYIPAPAMTYRELLDALATFTPEQLAMPVRWSGEERGGDIQRVEIFKEEHIDCGDGASPVSTYASDPPAECQIEARYPAGTAFLSTDNSVEVPRRKR